MDWVQQLPYDVVATVFSHSSFQACVICTRVCKAWRRFLLEHSDAMWTDMTMTTPSEDAREDYKASWLVWLSRAKGNRVRRFELYIKSRRLAVEALELMAFSKWNRLETLRLVGRIPSLDPAGRLIINSSSAWRIVISNCHSSLRELSLLYSGIRIENDDVISISRHCRRLTHLEYWDRFTLADSDESHFQFDRLPSTIPWTHLSWRVGYGIPFDDLLPRCHALQQLSLSGKHFRRHHFESLGAVLSQKLIPNLRYVKIGDFADDTPDSSQALDRTPGLREIRIASVGRDPDLHSCLAHITADIIVAHQATLSAAYLHFDLYDSAEFWESIMQQLAYPTLPLTTLEYIFPMHHQNGAQLADLVRRFFTVCPYLSQLKLHNMPWNGHQVLEVLSASPSLVDVELYQLRGSTDKEELWSDDVTYILPSLTRLVMSVDVDGNFLQHLRPLERLIFLDLSGFEKFSSLELKRFFMHKTPQLQVCSLSSINDEIATGLASLQSLHEVHSMVNDNITESGIKCLSDNGKQLISL